MKQKGCVVIDFIMLGIPIATRDGRTESLFNQPHVPQATHRTQTTPYSSQASQATDHLHTSLVTASEPLNHLLYDMLIVQNKITHKQAKRNDMTESLLGEEASIPIPQFPSKAVPWLLARKLPCLFNRTSGL